jgi:hypothetical protein
MVSGMSMDSDEMDERAHRRVLHQDYVESGSRYLVVIASDGIWEQLKPEEVGRLVVEGYREGKTDNALCEEIGLEAHRRWMTREGVQDDISIMITWLN